MGDAEIAEIIRKAEIVSLMLKTGDRIEYGSDTGAIDGLIASVRALTAERDAAADRLEELEGEWNGEAQALMNAGWIAPEEAAKGARRLADARSRVKAIAHHIEVLTAERDTARASLASAQERIAALEAEVAKFKDWAEWKGPGDAPPSWMAMNPNTGELTKVYRSYADYCDD